MSVKEGPEDNQKVISDLLGGRRQVTKIINITVTCSNRVIDKKYVGLLHLWLDKINSQRVSSRADVIDIECTYIKG